MAKRIKKWYADFSASFTGQMLTALIYAIMLMLILIFFTGNGTFIYEV